jgi:hypothetical protein
MILIILLILLPFVAIDVSVVDSLNISDSAEVTIDVTDYLTISDSAKVVIGVELEEELNLEDKIE